MEELDLKELFNIFWHKKVQIILIILIFMVIGVIYTEGFTTPLYSSSTTIVLASANQSSTSIDTMTATDITVNSKLVSTYSELIKSKNVLRQVITNLNININEDELRNNIKVSSVKNTELIEIIVTTKTPLYSEKIANEIAKVFTDKVKDIYHIENVQVVDEAEVNNTPSNINHKKDIVIFTVIGAIIAACYTLICNMLDTTVKTAEEIEEQFKLPVLASIPMCDDQMKNTKGGRRK